MCDAFAEIDRASADDAMDFVAFGKEELGEVGSVLSGYSCDECDVFCHNINIFL